MGKGMKRRFVYFHIEFDDRINYVDAWLNRSGITAGVIFPNANGEPITTRAFAYRLEKYTTIKPHDLRRSFARLLYNSGYDIPYISQQLGHTQLETTMRYVGALSGMDSRKRFKTSWD
jgi:site-specific recombinase XerD